MILWLLIIALTALLVVEYVVFRGEVIAPPIMLTGGLLVAACILSFFVDYWVVNLRWLTFQLLVGGVLCFSIASAATSAIMGYKGAAVSDGRPVTLSAMRLSLICFFQIAMYVCEARLLMSHYGSGDLAQVLVEQTINIKFDDNPFTLPSGISFFVGMAHNIGYIFAFLIPIYHKAPTTVRLWLVLNFVAACAGSLLTTGRTLLLYLLVSYVFFYMAARIAGKHKLNIGVIVKGALGAYIFLFSFQAIGDIIGRDTSEESASSLVAIYCGAEIQNLDDYLSKEIDIHYKPVYAGEATFQTLYGTLASYKLMKPLVDESKDFLPFNMRNGNTLGNVYTGFMNYYFDFGKWGTLLMMLFLGAVYMYLYIKCMKSPYMTKGIYSVPVFIFSVLAPASFMTFFSESMVDKLSAFFNYRFWIQYIIIFFMVYGVFPWQKSSLLSQTKKKDNNQEVN